ncbi:MAG: 50S ribosomal protein L22 [Bacteroidales bacterium]|jgi:large subunit ribosomal protein L22|nr:50S ribosomal protein L22 [Bacteroidales bacterium]MCR5115389.1 50S ribosomal protein L22 [Bacteroidales bacterium]
MGKRKRLAAEARKEANKNLYVARLQDNPTSPRKMRIMADVIRGKDVDYALAVLKYSKREAAGKLLKLLKSAVANWQVKNEGVRLEDSQLYVKSVVVDGGRMLKRIRTAPRGMAHRVRKRSNHVTIIIDDKNLVNNNTETQNAE